MQGKSDNFYRGQLPTISKPRQTTNLVTFVTLSHDRTLNPWSNKNLCFPNDRYVNLIVSLRLLSPNSFFGLCRVLFWFAMSAYIIALSERCVQSLGHGI